MDKKTEHKNDALTIDQIETLTDAALKNSTEGRREFIMNLFYLQKTERFKENKRYKKASFETYIKDRHRISFNAYMNERTAFTMFLPEIEKHGLDPIIKIRDKCGTGNIKKVSDILSKEKKKVAGGIISLEKEAGIIKQFERPKPEVVSEKLNTLTYSHLRSEVDRLRVLTRAQAQYIVELEERNERLIKALNTEKALNKRKVA